MRASLLDDLRCPYCGGPFEVIGRAREEFDEIDDGVLLCACCAYPVVEGIPVVALGDEITAAIRAIERGDRDAARRHVLDLPEERHGDFEALRHDGTASFATAVRTLLPDGEGDYYVLRYGDPTFLVADAVVRLVASRLATDAGGRSRLLDVCGGCGHLSTTLASLARGREGVTATLLDRSFWRLWLGRRYLAPGADVVCCDANAPLPLATGCALLTVCNDAFQYIWGKRLLASEMHRVTAWAGATVITHAHSSLGENATAGNTLTPLGYAALFERHPPVVGRDDQLLEWSLGRGPARWSADPAECGSADAVAVVATPEGATLDNAPAASPEARDGAWVINPLLSASRAGDCVQYRIAWPSDHYAAEFAAVLGYLPEELELAAAQVESLDALAAARPDLVTRRVLLNVPANCL